MVRIENWSRRWFIWIAFAIVMVSLGIRLWDLGHNSLWIDEIWTDSWMEASFGESLDLILENAVQPSLYFSLVYPFPNGGEYDLRFLSASMGAGGVALSIWLCAILYEKGEELVLVGADPVPHLEDGHIQGELPTFDPLEESGSPLDDWLPQRQSQITVQQPFNGVTVLVLDMDSGPRRE